MKVQHLSDQEIQAYVLAEQDPEKTAHLQSCEICRNNVLFYQKLLAEVKQLPEPVFDFDLPALVIGRLSPSRPRYSLKWYAVAACAVFLVLACVMLIWIPINKPWYFTGTDTLLTWLMAAASGVLFACLSIDMFLNYQRRMNMVDQPEFSLPV